MFSIGAIEAMAITFNHLNILAPAGNQCTSLFIDVLGLNVGERPNFPFNGHWLYQSEQALIHVIEENDIEAEAIGHIAFDVDMNLKELTDKLQQKSLPYRIHQVPDSDVVQVFLRMGGWVLELQTIDQSQQYTFPIFSQLQELV